MGRRTEFVGTKRFEVRRQLGAGGMGVVYEAFDNERRARVALKTLRELDPQSLYRFKKEFRALQGLEHPNLVSLGELIEDSGQWFFTMELIEGTNFLEYTRLAGAPIARPADVSPDQDTMKSQYVGVPANAGDGLFDESKLRAALGQLALGLAAIHDAGMVHRDVKPSNVLITRNERLVLLDFGLITHSTDALQSTQAHPVGTAAYMAPEQAASKQVGPEADWYSMGVVLYEALTGRVPFTGSTLQIFMDKQQCSPSPPSDLVPRVPADLDELCSELLQFEPKSRPTAREILKRLAIDPPVLATTGASSSQHTHSSLFVGREAELRILRDAFEDAQSGASVIAFVSGASGLGKSSLIRRATEELTVVQEDTVILRSRCYERESVPYKAFDGALDELTRYLRGLREAEAAQILPRNAAILPRVFPVLERVEIIAQAPRPRATVKDPHELRRRVFKALRELLSRISDLHPLVIVIDDLQWADAESLKLMQELVRPPDAPPLLLILGSRTELGGDTSDTVAKSVSELLNTVTGDARAIHLQPLDRTEAEMLAGILVQRANIAADFDTGTIAREAAGHPLFIAELVHHAAIASERYGGEIRLEQAIWTRVTRLPDDARRLLELVAVAGAPTAQDVVRAAARLDAAAFAKDLSLLRVANFIRTGSSSGVETVEPYHDRIREAVLGKLADDTRADHHSRMAVALEAAGMGKSQPELLLLHYTGAGDRRRAAGFAVEAGRRASAALAFDHAAAFYSAALRLGEYDDDARAERLRDLADALAHAGRGAEAADAYLEAAEGRDPTTRRDCQRFASEQLLKSGHIERGMEVTRQVLADVGAKLAPTPRRALLSLGWQRLKLRLHGYGWKERHPSEIAASDLARHDVFGVVGEALGMVDPIRGAEFQARGLLLALKLGERARVARALALESAYVASFGGRGRRRGARLIAEAREICERTPDPYLALTIAFAEGTLHYFAGNYRASTERLNDAETMAKDQLAGLTWELNSLRFFKATGLGFLGHWGEAQDRVEEYVRDAVRRGDLYAETTLRRLAGYRWLGVDQPEEALRDLDRTAWAPPDGAFHLQHWFELWSRGLIALYQGEVSARMEQLESLFAGLRGSKLLYVQNIRVVANWLWGRLWSELARSDEHRRRGLAEAKRSARRLERERIEYASTLAAATRAGVSFLEGGADAAVDKLREASELGKRNFHVFSVTSRYRLGETLGGSEGSVLIASTEAFARRERIAVPERLTDALIFRLP